jgi:segregation and condensation protein B
MSDPREPSASDPGPDDQNQAADGGHESRSVQRGVAEADQSLGPGEANLSAPDGTEDDEQLELGGPGLAGTVAALGAEDLKGALEALILVSDKPIAAMRLARLTRQDLGAVRKALAELREEYRGRGIALDEIAGGFQFRTSPRYAPFVRGLTQQKPTRLTRAQLEVLAIVAYRQPVTRPEIDDVRGVDSGSAIKVLLERDVIKIIGKREDVGRPMLYATTNEFLELFGLKALRDLPTLREFAELSSESRDIYERRIGEALPGEGMDLETHYEARAEVDAEPELDGEPEREPDPGPAAGATGSAGEGAAADERDGGS